VQQGSDNPGSDVRVVFLRLQFVSTPEVCSGNHLQHALACFLLGFLR